MSHVNGHVTPKKIISFKEFLFITIFGLVLLTTQYPFLRAWVMLLINILMCVSNMCLGRSGSSSSSSMGVVVHELELALTGLIRSLLPIFSCFCYVANNVNKQRWSHGLDLFVAKGDLRSLFQIA